MAKSKPAGAVEAVKDLWNSQINDEEKWAVNAKSLRAFGLFAGSIFFMRNFGELMAI
ncbi:mitochondrial import receptor subunit TOM5 homolog [Asparagus officinalis]|uniref:mitochondrial import receptor subunit TOM5 homolog n=1 Tax=Asparagus officinalis TaxID=4686 RepID=UPI00098DE4BD|nr:mitochondrial import receptor subunit TOM5 homolog [Asparagus officinalis]